MSKFEIEEHGNIYKLTHPEEKPVIICPECGEEAKFVRTASMYSDDRWYGYIQFEKEIFKCPNCNCKFNRKKSGSSAINLNWENIGAVSTVFFLISCILFFILGVVYESMVFATVCIISFFMIFVSWFIYDNNY